VPKKAVPAKSPVNLVRPLVRGLHAYVPGEQPKVKGLIKLNTNENPYPPSPKVLKAVQSAVDGRLRLYPNPSAQELREALARLHGCAPENLIVGNGSDELLALAVRAFAEPDGTMRPVELGEAHLKDSYLVSTDDSASRVQFFTPSYSLYPVLAETHGAVPHPVPLAKDFSLPPVAQLRRDGVWDFRAALTLITTPNAPSGRGYSRAELDTLCQAQKGVTILDEAYVDFAEENALELSLKHPHVLVSRTFSKAYSLCFQRVGYFVGHPALISALHTIRDSYNVNGLGQVAAVATLKDLPHYRRNFRRVVASRTRLGRELGVLGWEVLPSSTNFLLARPPGPPAKQWLELLRERKILVRWFRTPGIDAFLRITVGTDSEVDALLGAVRRIAGVRQVR
jgi:histidinol-phosphate aminotransferase